MRKAFTFVELIGCLAIIAILTGLIVPSATGILDGIRLRGAVAEITEAFTVARASAIRSSAFATIRIDATHGVVFVRIGHDTVFATPIAARYNVTLRSNRDSMLFTPLGVGYGAGNQSVIVSSSRSTDTVVVSRLGRVRH